MARRRAVFASLCLLTAMTAQHVVDDTGVAVRLERPARRIVSLAPSSTESLFAIGAGRYLVGVTRYDTHPAAAREIPRVGGFQDVDVERVLQLRPDLVLAAGFQRDGIVPKLRALGLAVFVVEPRNVDEVIDRMAVFGALVGAEADARRAAAELRARLRAVHVDVTSGSARPRTLVLLSNDLFSVGPGSFAHDLIERAGGVNIAADAATAYPLLSDEAVVARDPELILVGGHRPSLDLEALRARPGWAGVTAVRNGNVVVLEDPDLMSRPGPRIVDALELIRRAIRAVANGTGTRPAS